MIRRPHFSFLPSWTIRHAGTKKPGRSTGSFLAQKRQEDYSTVIASQGHSPAQAPQPTQSASLTSAAPSFMEIALTGQAPTQDSQPAHLLLSTFAAIVVLLV
jgi:hypothetical protein